MTATMRQRGTIKTMKRKKNAQDLSDIHSCIVPQIILHHSLFTFISKLKPTKKVHHLCIANVLILPYMLPPNQEANGKLTPRRHFQRPQPQ